MYADEARRQTQTVIDYRVSKFMKKADRKIKKVSKKGNRTAKIMVMREKHRPFVWHYMSHLKQKGSVLKSP